MLASVRWVPHQASLSKPTRFELSRVEEEMLSSQPGAAEEGAEDRMESDPEGSGAEPDADLPEGMSLHMHYKDNKEDPHLTGDYDDDMGSLSDEDDYMITESDMVLLSASNDEDQFSVEVQVYDPIEQNIYVHHDFPVPDFILTLEWLNFNPREPGSTSGSFVAIGAMAPQIELWNLNVVDALEPVCTLGGVTEQGELIPGSHEDGVLCLSWSPKHADALLSASADATVKLWDICSESAASTFRHHTDKVQALQWNPRESFIALTGSVDKTLSILDVRQTEAKPTAIQVGAEVECASWNPSNAAIIAVSSDNGMTSLYDIRNPSKPLVSWKAHDEPTTCLSWNAADPLSLATCSFDGSVKVWNLQEEAPVVAAEKDMKAGALLSVDWISSKERSVISAGGDDGFVAIWEL